MADPAVAAAPQTPIVGIPPRQVPTVETPPVLVALKCSERLSHLWGEATQTSAGQAHVAADGIATVPLPIGAALLEVCVEKGEPAFVPVSREDLDRLTEWKQQQAQAALPNGEGFGRLVRIQCPQQSGEPHTTPVIGPNGQPVTLTFDVDGYSITGEKVFEAMRPAFGGDGLREEEDAAPLIFHGYVQALESDKPAAPAIPAIPEETVPETTVPPSLEPPAETDPADSPDLAPAPGETPLHDALREVIPADKVQLLVDNGFHTAEALESADVAALTQIKGIGGPTAEKIVATVQGAAAA